MNQTIGVFHGSKRAFHRSTWNTSWGEWQSRISTTVASMSLYATVWNQPQYFNHSISTTLKDSQHWQSWNISRVFWSINVRTQLSKHQRPSTPWTSPCQKHNVNNLGCNFLFQILAQPPSVQSRLNDTTPICFVELHQTLGTWWYLHAVHASEF